MGRTHALSGFAAVLAAASLTGRSDLTVIGVCGVWGAGAALMPDWDHPEATVARTWGPLTWWLCELVEFVSLGHRKLTHSLLGVATFTAAAWAVQALASTAHPGLLPAARELPLLALLALLIGSGLRALRVADFEQESFLGLANLISSLGVGWAMMRLVPEAVELLPAVVAIGVLMHLALDMCTEGGCPVLAPLTWRDMWLVPKALRWQTADRERFIPEKHLVTPLLWVAVGWYGWRLAQAANLLHPIPSTQ